MKHAYVFGSPRLAVRLARGVHVWLYALFLAAVKWAVRWTPSLARSLNCSESGEGPPGAFSTHGQPPTRPTWPRLLAPAVFTLGCDAVAARTPGACHSCYWINNSILRATAVQLWDFGSSETRRVSRSLLWKCCERKPTVFEVASSPWCNNFSCLTYFLSSARCSNMTFVIAITTAFAKSNCLHKQNVSIRKNVMF